MSIYHGFKRAIEKSEENDYKGLYLPEWAKQLVWQGPQIMPSPYQEITRDEWLIGTQSGFECLNAVFSEGWNIPTEFKWFGGWSVYLYLYYTHGLACLKINYDDNIRVDNRLVLGKGIKVERGKGYGIALRFFRIGCEHKWVGVPEKSYMSYHASRCTICGMEKAVDSSG